MKTGVFVIILITVLFAAIFFIQKVGYEKECSNDAGCVPACGCHPDSCVPKDKASNCSKVLCTQECKPNTLDCQQGRCICQDGKCLAQINMT